MYLEKSSMRRVFSALAVTSCLLAGIPAIALAQGLPGLTIFSGVERQNQLNFRLDYGRRSLWDNYRLRIPANKMQLAVSQINISYPDYYTGQFDTNRIEVLARDKSIPVREVNWDRDNHSLQISLTEPIEPGDRVEVILSNVRNPDFGGTYYFHARVISPGDIPLPRYVGTWILDVN